MISFKGQNYNVPGAYARDDAQGKAPTERNTDVLPPLEKSIIRIAGDQHHISELQKLESMLYSKFDLEKLYDELVEYLEKEFPDKTARTITVKDLQRIDEFIKERTLSKITVAESYIVRSYVIGHIIEERKKTLIQVIQYKPIDLIKLPETICPF